MPAGKPSLLVFDRASSRAVDRTAVEEFGIPSIVLMENAARALAANALEMMHASPGSVLIVCGSGNNGGDGYAAARHLHNAGCEVTLCARGEPRAQTDAAVNRAICERMRLRFIDINQLERSGTTPALVIDALVGTGLDRQVEGEAARLIQLMNEMRSRGSRILAADIPSGLDCDTGRELGTAVRADRTISFVGWKKGFLTPGIPGTPGIPRTPEIRDGNDAAWFTGEVVVGDIGAPAELVRRLGSARQ